MSTPPSTDTPNQTAADRAADDGHTGSPESIVQALTQVSERVQGLVREEVELAKAEVQLKATRIARGAAIGAAAAVFAIGALALILQGLSWLAWWALPVGGTQYFWGFFLVAAVLLVLGALAGFVAARSIRSGTPPAPTMAIDEAKLIKETVTSPQPEATIPVEARR